MGGKPSRWESSNAHEIDLKIPSVALTAKGDYAMDLKEPSSFKNEVLTVSYDAKSTTLRFWTQRTEFSDPATAVYIIVGEDQERGPLFNLKCDWNAGQGSFLFCSIDQDWHSFNIKWTDSTGHLPIRLYWTGAEAVKKKEAAELQQGLIDRDRGRKLQQDGMGLQR